MPYTSNVGKDWDDEDLQLLSTMIRDKVSMKYMRQILGRSENAIHHAIRNMMYHHLIDNHIEKVARHYKTSTDVIANSIVPCKYNVPLPSCSAATDSSVEATDDNDDEVTSAPNRSVSGEHLCTVATIISVLGTICIVGTGLFTVTMCREWNALAMS